MADKLAKVDSGVQGLSQPSATDTKEKSNRRASSAAAPGVKNINDLRMAAREATLG